MEDADKKKNRTLSAEIVGEVGTAESCMETSELDDQQMKLLDALDDRLESRLSTMISAIVGQVMEKMQTQVTKLQAENKMLTDRVESLERRIGELERAEDSANQYSRRNCLRVSGVKETEGENIDDVVIDLCKGIGVDIKLDEIDRTHRLGRKIEHSDKSSKRPRDIIVKFATYRSRQKLFKARRSLRGHSKHKDVYINEELTRARSELYYNARMLVKARLVVKTWTSDGVIFVEDRHNRVHRCDRQNDLAQFK